MDAFRAERDAAELRAAREAEFREMVLAAIAVPSPDDEPPSVPAAEAGTVGSGAASVADADAGADEEEAGAREAREREFLEMFAEAIRVPSPDPAPRVADETADGGGGGSDVMSAAESLAEEMANEEMAAAAREATERIDVDQFAQMLAAAIQVPSDPEDQ